MSNLSYCSIIVYNFILNTHFTTTKIFPQSILLVSFLLRLRSASFVPCRFVPLRSARSASLTLRFSTSLHLPRAFTSLLYTLPPHFTSSSVLYLPPLTAHSSLHFGHPLPSLRYVCRSFPSFHSNLLLTHRTGSLVPFSSLRIYPLRSYLLRSLTTLISLPSTRFTIHPSALIPIGIKSPPNVPLLASLPHTSS